MDYSTYYSLMGILLAILPIGISSILFWIGCCFSCFISTGFYYYLGAYLAIIILFFYTGLVCYETDFLLIIPGESWITNLRSYLVSLIFRESLGGWSLFDILLSDKTVFDLISNQNKKVIYMNFFKWIIYAQSSLLKVSLKFLYY